ncbi:MAG: hypothetical protein L0212_12135 [Acidobacteria bacterium]|nr:hypothetical protein [Acidobacteriota bacterium]
MPVKDIPIHPEQPPQILSLDGVLLREDTLYTNRKGKEKRGIRKRAEDALAKLKGTLAAVLEPDEAVLFVARGQAPTTLVEQLTFGYYIYYVTASLLVFTNRRMLDFHLDVGSFGRWKWTHGLRAVRWGDVQQAAVKGLLTRSLELKYRTGKKETYHLARWSDANKIKMLVPSLLHGSAGEASPAQGMVSLCPDCYAFLAERADECSGCQLRFKTTKEMIWRSVLFPGGGYFYTGHWSLGILDALVESFLVFGVAMWVAVAAGFAQPFRGPLEPQATSSEALAAAAFLVVILAIEKLFTIYHGKRFLQVFIPARARPSRVRWALFAVGVYGLIGLSLSAVTQPRPTLAQLAPDLAVETAEFGTFGSDQQGNLTFSAATLVPRTQGQSYGWVMSLRTTRPKVHVLEEHIVWDVSVERDGGEPQPLTLNNEYDFDALNGVIYSTWTTEADEPSGRRTFKVYIEGTLVKEFQYTVP